MPRQAFDEELRALQEQILKMGGLVEEAVRRAVRSLVDQDLDEAERVIEGDDLVDKVQQEIEEQSLRLIALQQPLARDLRTVATILRVIIDLERIGDHAVNIALITRRIGHEPLIKPLIDIPRMAELTDRMVKGSLDSLVKRDTALAERICHADDEVDELYASLFDELIGFVLAGGDVRRATQAINLLFVARYLERIADHATNIAEGVIFLVTGNRVHFNREPQRDRQLQHKVHLDEG
ncbi:MAG TPA: phosphate signaling complex protein PhoU [Firmicutes bacterium]|nr:phosphate signaling complex protein PhoU [Bacillota bacterium]